MPGVFALRRFTEITAAVAVVLVVALVISALVAGRGSGDPTPVLASDDLDESGTVEEQYVEPSKIEALSGRTMTPIPEPEPSPKPKPKPKPAPAAEPPPPLPPLRAVPFHPVAMELPSLNVVAPMDAEGPEADGVLGVPSDPARLGWYEGGAIAGAHRGTLLAYGHVVNAGYGNGALYYLKNAKVGDPIVLRGDRGQYVNYKITSSKIHHKNRMPVNQMFERDGTHRIALYTCNGEPDSTGHRTYRVVVWAEQVGKIQLPEA